MNTEKGAVMADVSVEAMRRLTKYIERRNKAKQIDVDYIHGFDASPEGGFELRLSDIEAVLAALRDELSVKGDDTKRLDWLSSITKLNSAGTTNTKAAMFTILPAWDQLGRKHLSLRDSIDAAINKEQA